MTVMAGSEDWFADIVAAIADGVTVQDPTGRLVYANEAAAHLIGFPTVEALLTEAPGAILEQFEIFDEAGNPFPASALPGRIALAGEYPDAVTLRFRHKATGADRWSIVKARPVLGPDRQSIFAVNIFHDITERKLSEPVFDQNRQRLQAIFDNTRDSIVIFDDAGAVTDANPAACRLTGYTREELLGQTAAGLVSEERQAGVRTNWDDFRAAGDQSAESVIRRRDGSRVTVEYLAVADFFPGLHLVVIRDIDERKRAELERAQTNARLNGIIASAMDAIISINAERKIIVFNPAAERLFGYRAAEIIGHPLDILVPERLREVHRQHVEAFTATHSEERAMSMHELAFGRRANGEEFPIEATISQVDVGGQIIQTVILRDISERRQAELALAQERQLMRLLIDHLPDYVYVKDRDSRFIMTNIAHARLMGASASDAIVGKTDYEFFARSLAEKYHRDEREVVATGVAKFDIEEPTLSADGRDLTVLTTKLPLRNEAGEIIGLLGVSRDITERKRAEERIRQLYELTTALSQALTFDDVMEVIVQKAFAMLGGVNSGMQLVSDDGDTLEQLYYSNMAGEVVQTYKRVPLTLSAPMTDVVRTGEPVWIETADQYQHSYPELFADVHEKTHTNALACLPLFVGGRVIGGLGTSFLEERAFTLPERAYMEAIARQCAQALERARLYESERRARVEAERANAVKLQFLGMISHELRTPLASIKGFSSSLLARDVNFDVTEQREFMQIIDSEADKLTELVSQLLDLSRLQAGSLRVTAAPVSFHHIVNRGRPQFESLTADHNLRLLLSDDMPPVLADQERVSQVLANLIGNAAKYSPPGSTITVTTQAIDSELQVDVHDEGVGIPINQRAAVFEAFRQLERGQGAGLGLAICKGLIEAHGGSIWIQERPGPGTTVSFTLPLA